MKHVLRTLLLAWCLVLSATAFGQAAVVVADGTNAVAIKGASTAPAATDPALVVALSPNSSPAQGSTTSGQSGQLVQAAATTAAPTYTDGQTDPLTQTLNGAMRVDLFSGGGTALAFGTGVSGSGVPRFVLASNTSQIPTWGHGSTASAVPSGATYIGCNALTSNPTNAVTGRLTGIECDKKGAAVVVLENIREMRACQHTALAANTETTIVTGTASEFHDIESIVITTAGSAAATLTLKDGTAGTTMAVWNYPNAATAPAAPFSPNLGPIGIPQGTAANNWTITNSVATATDILICYVKNK